MTETVADPSLDVQFFVFDCANPRVYIEFRRLALEMYSAKLAKRKTPIVGAKAVWERLRWEVEIDTTKTFGDFALNNDLVSRYARKLAEEDSRFVSAFHFRKLKSKEA